jgi:protein-S-isoprenylcysteine O-methyltransferase Ste14
MTQKADDIPGVIAPPPLIALATILLGLAADWLFPVFVLKILLTFYVRVTIGVAVVACGAALALAAERKFKQAGTNVMPWKPSLALATAGVYATLRNPMYVALAMLVGGIAVALASDWMLVLVIPMFAVLHYGVVVREERYLERKFGDDYRRYKDSVPRYGWPP